MIVGIYGLPAIDSDHNLSSSQPSVHIAWDLSGQLGFKNGGLWLRWAVIIK